MSNLSDRLHELMRRPPSETYEAMRLPIQQQVILISTQPLERLDFSQKRDRRDNDR